MRYVLTVDVHSRILLKPEKKRIHCLENLQTVKISVLAHTLQKLLLDGWQKFYFGWIEISFLKE